MIINDYNIPKWLNYFFVLSFRNLGLLNLLASDELYQPMLSRGWPWINTTDPSSVSLAEYREWYSHHSSLVGANITDCSLEEEMNKVSIWHLQRRYRRH